MTSLFPLRENIRHAELADEMAILTALLEEASISKDQQALFTQQATSLVKSIRQDDQPGLMEAFLAEYGLSTTEGVALMCLAEALLRVPDSETIDDLIEDKIAPSSWGHHLGKSSSSLVNASTWALMLTGNVLDTDDSPGLPGILRSAVKRLGEPVIRVAVKRAMKEMGNQFVLGETIEEAIKRGAGQQAKGFSYSYDMLGEAALTANDADGFFSAYEHSIKRLAKKATSKDTRENPGISIKLSALHPRYEVSQTERVLAELVERTLELALLAMSANIGLNIDAEEADRLDLSLDVIEAVLRDKRLEGWPGFGVVVQAYSKRASGVIDWLYALAKTLDRKIMVRLVKGAYWDTEIKRAQVEGLKSYPVFTRKSATDVSFICCAKKLLGLTDRIFPQFATHNAHSVATILNLSDDHSTFEFQRLHGMGTVMHRLVMESEQTHCRIYAPVGAHKNLLAYLVRRLLENGANSSFVNQIVDEDVAPELVAACPFESLNAEQALANPIPVPQDIYAPKRKNSKGWDLHNEDDIVSIEAARLPFRVNLWHAKPILVSKPKGGERQDIYNPYEPSKVVGTIIKASEKDVDRALLKATDWSKANPKSRAEILNKAADLYEENFGEIFALLTREAGKTMNDAIGEIREAVDFLRYYAYQGQELFDQNDAHTPRGLIACISPWNFPLAIFTGQIAAALAAGNGVLAKPAEQTPLIAFLAVKLLHRAGVPKSVLQLLPGEGRTVGSQLVASPRINGVCFTGSTATAQIINRTMSKTAHPDAPLIAETGGLNAMVVDSTALPEQAIQDIVASAFQSAGQRCSALRLLYLQSDIAPEFLEMLYGAMSEQVISDPWELSTDIGPIIDENASVKIRNHIQKARLEGRLLNQLSCPDTGHFIGPAVISVSGIQDMEEEIFGPVLHIATFESNELENIVSDINDSQYGLTFGLHTRIDNRVEFFTKRLNVGNMYVNRNQIGAVVGSQPFGGEGLSGTGPKAGGPHYVKRFTAQAWHRSEETITGKALDTAAVQNTIHGLPETSRAILRSFDLPGPTGESNRLSVFARGLILCLGPSLEDAQEQAEIARSQSCNAVIIAPGVSEPSAFDGTLQPEQLAELSGFEAVAFWGSLGQSRDIRMALSTRPGVIIPLLGKPDMAERCILERHVCIDTTASGGNVALLSGL